jgi:hypothetical protein
MTSRWMHEGITHTVLWSKAYGPVSRRARQGEGPPTPIIIVLIKAVKLETTHAPA